MKRILPVNSICESLWANQTLRLSSQLSSAYLERLQSQGLMEMASDQTKANGEPGGATEEESDKHFAFRFVNSAGRNLCAALDPHDKLGDVSNSLLAPMFGERILIVDIPCGAGAGGLALLDSIRELRVNQVLAPLPLRVDIVAGDIAPRALEHYRELFSKVRGELAAASISVNLVTLNWDVSDVPGNAAFVDTVITSAANANHVLVIASNFSDAMANEVLFEHFRHFLSQLMGRLAHWPTTVCWIEPRSRRVKKYLPPISDWVDKFMSWLKSAGDDFGECNYQMYDPVARKEFRSGVVVLQCSSKARA